MIILLHTPTMQQPHMTLSRDQTIFVTLLRDEVDTFFPLHGYVWQGTRAELEHKFYRLRLLAKNLTSTLELSDPGPDAPVVQHANNRKRKAESAEANGTDKEPALKRARLSHPRKAKKLQ